MKLHVKNNQLYLDHILIPDLASGTRAVNHLAVKYRLMDTRVKTEILNQISTYLKNRGQNDS